MIQLAAVPGGGDILTTGAGDLVGVSEPVEFGVGVLGELNLGDHATIGGVVYTITDWDGLEVNYTHSDGAGGTTVTLVNTVRLTLTDSAGNELVFMVPTDGAGDLPDITQAEIVSTGTNPDGLSSGWNQQLSGNQVVTLATATGGPDYIVEGTAGDDLIDVAYTGDPEGDMVDAGDNLAGNDDDVIEAYGGNDTVYAGFGNDQVDAGTGDDTVYGQDGDDTIFGGEGNDFLHGGNGSDSVYGGTGDDTVEGNGGADYLDGGAGDDVVRGGDGADIVIGDAGDDELYGNGGDDTIYGGDGSDTVYGGNGNDTIDTGGSAPASDYGWPGVIPPDADPFDDRDVVYGNGGDDVISTGDDQDYISGGNGNDTIDGGLDDDTIDGNAGDDMIIGGHGSDVIDGGTGDDTIYGGMGPGTDSFNIPDDDVPGDAFPGPDPVTDNGIDVIHGGDGNDTIYGQDDNDELYGDAGDDTIYGGIDDDLIDGGAGNDMLYGGADQDTFVNVNAGDTVDGGSEGAVDFDTLDLTGSAPAGGTLQVTVTGPDSNGNGFDGYVTYYDDAGNVTGTLNFTEIEDIIPCFTPGTMIATPKGERAVETLREGDKVITRDNGIQEIRWAGEKKMGWQDFAVAEHLKPVLIREGALGNGLPERDILVSPNHRVLVANDRTALYFEEREVLVAAKHLVDNKGIMKVDTMGTSYIHFMFDHHEVVLSNGAWTESFQPGDYSLKGLGNAQRAEIFELFPELEQEEGIRDYAAARRTLKKHEAKILLK